MSSIDLEVDGQPGFSIGWSERAWRWSGERCGDSLLQSMSVLPAKGRPCGGLHKAESGNWAEARRRR